MRGAYAFNALSFLTNAALCFLLYDLNGAKVLFWMAGFFLLVAGGFAVKWICHGK